MKTHHYLLITAGALVGGYAYYWHKQTKPVGDRGVLGGNNKGYTSMMKISPQYYNNTAFEGRSLEVTDFTVDIDVPTPWTLGTNGGDGSQVNAGWTSYPDTYSAKVSNNWLQQEAQEARL